MTQLPYGAPPPPEDEDERDGNQIEIEVDQGVVDQGQQLLQAVAGGQTVGENAPILDAEPLPEGTTPDDAAREGRRDRLEEIQQERSEAQQSLDASDNALSQNRADLAMNSEEEAEAKDRLSALDRQQKSLAAYSMEQEGLLGWRESWPWVSAYLDADDPNDGVLDTTFKYLEGLGVTGQIVSGVGRAAVDVPGRLGDFVYDATSTGASTDLAPFTRFSGMPDSVAGSLSYNFATYVAPFVAGAGAGTAAAAGAGVLARIAAGTIGGFAVNRATDMMFDPVHEGGAASATRDVIQMLAEQSEDPDAYLDEPRLGGMTLRDLSEVASTLDSREWAQTQGRFAGRVAIAAEGAILDLTLGGALVTAGVLGKAGVKSAARGVASSQRTVRDVARASRLAEAARLNKDVDVDTLLQSIDEVSLGVLDRTGESALDVRDRILGEVDRYLRPTLRRIRSGRVDPDVLTAPLSGDAISPTGVLNRFVLPAERTLTAGARVAGLVTVRRQMADQIRRDVRDEFRRATRDTTDVYDVRYQGVANPDAETLDDATRQRIRESQAADAGGDATPLPEGAAGFSRVPGIDSERFHTGIKQAAAEHKYGAAVEVKASDFYADPLNRVYMADDGSAGVVIDGQGDMVSAFRRPGSSADFGAIMSEAVRHGVTGDAYDINSFLPSLYGQHGFRVAARVRFNEAFMPANWDLDVLGRPDIVLLVRDPEGKTGLPLSASKEEWQSQYRDATPIFDDWNDAADLRDQIMRDSGIAEQITTQLREASDPNRAPDPIRETMEVERRLDDMGLSLSKIEPYFEEYVYQMMRDPVNGFDMDEATARMQARFAARTGQMFGVDLSPDDIREIDRTVSSQIIGMPEATARTLFQKSDIFHKDAWKGYHTGMASDMIRSVMDTPDGMRAGVDLNNVRGDESAILIRPRPETGEDLTTLKGGRYRELAENAGTPEMAGMDPITDEELLQIHRDSVMEMLDAGLLPEALARNSDDPVATLQNWLRKKYAKVPSSAKDWESALGKTIREGGGDEGKVLGFKDISSYEGIALDPTYGLTVDDITAAVKKKHLKADEGKWLIDHISKQAPQRRMLLTLPNAEFWNRALTREGSDRGRFWYQNASERLFGDEDPLINPEGMPEGWLQPFNDMLSITSARTAVDANWLKALHNFSRVTLDESVPVDTDALGRHSQIRLASLGIGAEDSDNYKVNNFGIANNSTKPRDQLAYGQGATTGRADPRMGSASHYDLPVNDVIMAGLFRVNEETWSSYAMYQLAVRQQRRLRNLLNERRARLERTNPLDSGPREVWEMREVQSLPWDTFVGSGVDGKPPASPYRDAFEALNLTGPNGEAPKNRKRASDFVQSAEQMMEVLAAHPKTKHYYDPANPNAKIYASGQRYLDREVLTDDAVWSIFQETPRRKARSAAVRMTYAMLDRITPAGEIPLSKRIGALLAIRDNPVAQRLTKSNYNALFSLGTNVMEAGRKAMASITRARQQPTQRGTEKSTITVGELIAAMLGKPSPNVTAATTDEAAIVKQSIGPTNVVDDDTNRPGWRLGGPMSIDADGKLQPEFLVTLQTLDSYEERRVAAAAMAYALNDPQEVVKYIPGPEVRKPATPGNDVSFASLAAQSTDRTIRDLNSSNVATRESAEKRTVLAVEILHPEGNAGQRLANSLKTAAPGTTIVEQGGQVIRLHGNSKRELYEEVRSVAGDFDVTKIRIEAMDNDSFVMTPDEGRRILGDTIAERVLVESDDKHFLNPAAMSVAKEDMPLLSLLDPASERPLVFGLNENDDTLRSAIRDRLTGDEVSKATRKLVKHFRGSTRRAGAYDASRDANLAVLWNAAGLSVSYADDGKTFTVGMPKAFRSEHLGKTMVASMIQRQGAAAAVDQLDAVLAKVRGSSVAYRQSFWMERMVGQLDDLRSETDVAFRKLDEYNNDIPTTNSKGKVQPPVRPKILAGVEKLGEDTTPFMRFQQQPGGDIRGVTFAPEAAGYAMIRGFNNGDVSTGIEELTHAIRVVATSRGRRSPSYTTAEFDSLAQVVGVQPGGDWSIAADENLADLMKAFVLRGEVPDLLPARTKWVLSVMAAELRDVWRDGSRAGAAGLTASAVMRQDVIRRLDTMDLPIRVGEGRYAPAVDWTEMRQHAASLARQGKKWQDVIDPSDILAHARIFTTDQRGLFTPASARQTILSDPKARNAMRWDTHFPKGTREEMFEAMAYFEDFVRSMRNSDSMLERRSVAEMRDEAITMFGRLLNQTDDEVYSRLDDLMRVDLRSDQLADRVMTVNMFTKFQLHNVIKASRKAEKSKDAFDYAMLDREFRIFQQAQHYSAQFMTQLGRGLRSLKDPIDVPTQAEIVKLKQVNKAMGGVAEIEARGRDLVQMLKGLDVENYAAAAARQIEAANQSVGYKVVNSAQELYVNSLLSGPRTFLGLTIAGPAMMTMVQGMERALGGAYLAATSGNMSQLAAVGRNFKGMVLNTMTALKYAAHAMQDEAPRFMDTSGLYDTTSARYAISPENYGVKDPGPVYSLINLAGQAIRSPTRAIMTIDEFFRQLHGRQGLFHEAYDRAIEDRVAIGWDEGMIASKGEERVARRAFHDDAKREAERTVDRMVRDGRLRTKEVLQQEALEQAAVQAEPNPMKKARLVLDYMQQNYTTRHRELVKTAEDYATRAVFQSELGELGRMGSAMLDRIPGGRIIVPFYRTPVNIMTRFGGWLPTTLAVEAIDRGVTAFSRRRARAFDGSAGIARKPVLRGIHQKTMEDLLSGDPRRVAEARGRQAFGLGIVTLGYFLAANGMMTGRGPATEKKRRAWSQTNQPYSIRMGDQWVSYLKMDPVGMHLGLMADAFEILIAQEFAGGVNEEKQDLVQAMIMAFGMQIKKAPYLQGIASLMQAMENVDTRGQTLARNTITSFIPFSGLQRQTLAARDDAAFHEIRSSMDSIRARTWFGSSDEVAPARTPLGDMLEVQPTNDAFVRWANLVNPMMWMEESPDLVYRTINDLGMVLDMPREVRDGINWRVESIDGYPHTAYDYWLERIGTTTDRKGNTLRDRLMSMFTPDGKYHNQFRAAVAAGRAADGSSLAEDMIRDVITAYTEQGYYDMLKANGGQMRQKVEASGDSLRQQAATYKEYKKNPGEETLRELLNQ